MKAVVVFWMLLIFSTSYAQVDTNTAIYHGVKWNMWQQEIIGLEKFKEISRNLDHLIFKGKENGITVLVDYEFNIVDLRAIKIHPDSGLKISPKALFSIEKAYVKQFSSKFGKPILVDTSAKSGLFNHSTMWDIGNKSLISMLFCLENDSYTFSVVIYRNFAAYRAKLIADAKKIQPPDFYFGTPKSMIINRRGPERVSVHPDYLFYNTEKFDFPCVLSYHFKDDILISTSYSFESKYISKNLCVQFYETIQDNVSHDFWKPNDVSIDWNNTYYKDQPAKIGEAVSKGDVQFRSYWKDILGNTISLWMYSYYGEIKISLSFSDTTSVSTEKPIVKYK